MNRRWWVLGAVGLLAACGGGDDDDALADVPADERYELNDDVTVVIHEVIDPLDVVRDRAPEMRDAVAPAGLRWVAVEVEHVNSGDDVVDMSMTYAITLTTMEGHQGEGVSIQRDDMPEPGNAIPPGGSARGWHAYAVPADDGLGTLLLYGGEIGEEPVVVDLPLD